MKAKRVPVGELDFSFSRSSGAGGQNVNKVNTKVTMRWNMKKSASFSKEAVERMFLCRCVSWSRKLVLDKVISTSHREHRQGADADVVTAS